MVKNVDFGLLEPINDELRHKRLINCTYGLIELINAFYCVISTLANMKSESSERSANQQKMDRLIDWQKNEGKTGKLWKSERKNQKD